MPRPETPPRTHTTMSEEISTNGGRLLQALARRYDTAERETLALWGKLRLDRRNEDLRCGYQRGLRRCWTLREAMEMTMRGGAR